MLASPGAPLTSVSVAPACGTSRPTAEGSPAYASQAPAAGTAGLRRDLSGASSLSDNSGQCNTSGSERQEQAMLVLQQHQVVMIPLLLSTSTQISSSRYRSIRRWGGNWW